MLQNRPILDRQETQKRIFKNLAIARRKLEQIVRDQVNDKLTKSQITKLSTIMGAGTALNKNKERQNANEQIFLNNRIKVITGKNLLTFETSVELKG